MYIRVYDENTNNLIQFMPNEKFNDNYVKTFSHNGFDFTINNIKIEHKLERAKDPKYRVILEKELVALYSEKHERLFTNNKIAIKVDRSDRFIMMSILINMLTQLERSRLIIKTENQDFNIYNMYSEQLNNKVESKILEELNPDLKGLKMVIASPNIVRIVKIVE